ncbi:MAG: hypothetical protein DRI83_03315 [Bacteroidetes bacterium]|nr:MAG: hypothetical protein DRI83_03315 [Bacteroidota bacterium]
MKKLLLFAIAFCFIGGTVFSQISFGPKAGFNLSKYAQNYKDSDNEDYLKFRLGPSVGAVMDMPLNDFISFQPSVMFSVKGTAHNLTKMSDNHPNHTYDGYDRVSVMYFEIPVNFAGKMELGPGTAQVFIGPYFAMAFSGRNNYDYTVTKLDGTKETVKGDENVKFRGKVSEEDQDVEGVAFYQKPLDMGFDFGIGYQWNQLLFNFGYAMGLTNLQSDYEGVDFDPSDYKYSNRTIFFNVAWLFGGE